MANQYQQWFNQAANAYGTNAGLLSNIAKLESSYNPTAQNNWDSNARAGTPSYGLFQFIKPTFQSFSRQARAANPNAWQGVGGFNWKDPRQQTLTAAWAMANGKGSHWATYDRAKGMPGGAVPNGAGGMGGSTTIMSPGRWAKGRDPETVARQNGRTAQKVAEAWVDAPALGDLWSQKITGRNKPKWIEGTPQVINGSAPAGGGKLSGNYNQRFSKLMNMFGLKFDSGGFDANNRQFMGGNHESGSLHYSGRAADFGNAKNSQQKLLQLANYVRSNPGLFSEFYYDPVGWYVKNGKIVKGSIGGHGDHAHVGF